MIRNAAILTDVTRCIGCEECVGACQKANGLPQQDAPPRPGGSSDGLSANRWISVLRRSGNRFVRKQCSHCLKPACVSVCPVGALKKTAEGPVVYDRQLCMGCRYCMVACPYGIPRYQWNSVTPSVRKCVLCYSHLRSGRLAKPGCVAACPTATSTFGTREEMLAEAKRRLSQEPRRYIQRVWGETQVGGASVLYISNISLDFLGWQNSRHLTDAPLPDRTWTALTPVPFEFVGVGILMGAISWVIERRQRFAHDVAPPTANSEGGEPTREH